MARRCKARETRGQAQAEDATEGNGVRYDAGRRNEEMTPSERYHIRRIALAAVRINAA